MSIAKKDLWEKILQKNEQAHSKAAIFKTETRVELIRDQVSGIDFLIRFSESLNSKPKSKKINDEKPVNPFLNINSDLLVQNLGSRHRLLFNKFNLVDFHMLVVTQSFEKQEDPLNIEDFKSALEVMQCMPRGALVFYNSGPSSGASQPHKHLQIVPLPLSEENGTVRVPVEILIDDNEGSDGVVEKFPFLAMVAKLDKTVINAEYYLDAYFRLIEKAKAEVISRKMQWDSSYNLLLTDSWMMFVPRKSETFGPFNLNSLAFAGTFFIRSNEEMVLLKEQGPMNILKEVAFDKI